MTQTLYCPACFVGIEVEDETLTALEEGFCDFCLAGPTLDELVAHQIAHFHLTLPCDLPGIMRNIYKALSDRIDSLSDRIDK